ncbi:hypothetical protein BH11MYX1_BH11MYX1_46900 [soil metagenome]
MGLVKAVAAAGAAAALGLLATKRRAITNAVKNLLHHDEEAAMMSAPARIAKRPGQKVPRAERRRARRAARYV